MFSFFKKDVGHLSSYRFKYKVGVSTKMGQALTDEYEAIVKASSFDEAKRKLEKDLLNLSRIKILVTHPIEERGL